MEFHDNFYKTKTIQSSLEYGTMISNPDFTLSIPIYGKSVYFEETLKNVISLNHFGLNVQLLISDNKEYKGSSNPIIETLMKYKLDNVAYFRCDPIGQLNNFNRCVILAETDYVGLLHDDDLLAPNYFEFVSYALRFFKKKKRIGMLHQDQLLFSGSEVPNTSINNFTIKKRLNCQITHSGYSGTALPTCGMIVNKSAFLESGGFDDTYFASGDAFLSIAMMSKKWKIVFSTDILGYYRIGINNSLKIDICKSFIEQDKMFRDYWASTSLFRKIHLYFFERLIYSKSIEGKVRSFGAYNPDITIQNLDYLKKYKKYKKWSFICIIYLILGKLFNLFSKMTVRSIKI